MILPLKMGLEGVGYKVDLFTDPRKLIRELSLASILYYLVDIRMPR